MRAALFLRTTPSRFPGKPAAAADSPATGADAPRCKTAGARVGLAPVPPPWRTLAGRCSRTSPCATVAPQKCVQATPSAVHADQPPGLLQPLRERQGRELHALVGVEALRLASAQFLVEHLLA